MEWRKTEHFFPSSDFTKSSDFLPFKDKVVPWESYYLLYQFVKRKLIFLVVGRADKSAKDLDISTNSEDIQM